VLHTIPILDVWPVLVYGTSTGWLEIWREPFFEVLQELFFLKKSVENSLFLKRGAERSKKGQTSPPLGGKRAPAKRLIPKSTRRDQENTTRYQPKTPNQCATLLYPDPIIEGDAEMEIP